MPVSLAAQEQDSLKQSIPFEGPWKFMSPLNSVEVTNDSLLRWQVWPSWSDWFSYDPATISYRQGTIGRIDNYLINGTEARFQKHNWSGMELNDPVSGMINLSIVPHHKLSRVSMREQGLMSYDYAFKDYYSRVPITQLNFDESKFKYRNLEFLFARNFNVKTQLELSYWDRRDGDAYARSDVLGSQLFGKLSHQFSENWMIRANWLRNEFENEESFGYNLTNPASFSFDRFSVSAVQGNGSSDTKNRMLSASVHFSPDGKEQENLTLGMYRKFDSRSLRYGADTTRYEVRNYGLNLIKHFDIMSSLKASIKVNADLYANDDSSNVKIENWYQMKSEGELKYQLEEFFSINATSIYTQRESQSAPLYSVGLSLFPESRFDLDYQFSIGEQLPTIQALHWKSVGYTGNQNLSNESLISASGQVAYKFPFGLKLGIRSALKDIENGILLDSSTGSFVNVPSYSVLSATPFLDLNTERWELGLSGTLTDFGSSGASAIERQINSITENLLMRGSIYFKSPIYNAAAFLKVGFEGTFSPQAVQTYAFIPDLGYWALLNNNLPNPAYYRVDLNLSARVRSIFFLIRMENLFDAIGQAGYFESVGYPMPPRRLIMGIRVLFKN